MENYEQYLTAYIKARQNQSQAISKRDPDLNEESLFARAIAYYHATGGPQGNALSGPMSKESFEKELSENFQK